MHREARVPAAPAEHGARHVRAASTAPIRSSSRCGPSVHFRAHEAPVSEPLGCAVRVPRGRRPLRDLRSRAAGCRRCGCRSAATSATFTLEPARDRQRAVSGRGEPRLRGARAICGARATSASMLRAGQRGDAGRVDRVVGDDERARARRGAATPSASRRERLLALRRPAARDGHWPPSSCSPPTSSSSRPAGRVEDAARARAAGDEVRTVIAGYHWFTDWGRDTMISLEGLTLATGRHARGGLHPAHVRALRARRPDPEHVPGGREGGPVSHRRRDALVLPRARPLRRSHRRSRARCARCFRRSRTSSTHHLRGTRFGIGVDPADGLLRQGAEGYQLTWMDAKVDDWVVTPRRGKAVEINALWYNALRLLEQLAARGAGDAAARHVARARRARARSRSTSASGTPSGGYLYDVVDGEDGDDDRRAGRTSSSRSRCRIPVLDRARWDAVVDVVREQLLTPVGLRSLAPGHPDYKPHYYGDLRARDAAYHQGTVWALADRPVRRRLAEGPSRTTCDGARQAARGLRAAPRARRASARSARSSTPSAPYTPRGCIAQAWSVAEVLRVTARLASLEQTSVDTEATSASTR